MGFFSWITQDTKRSILNTHTDLEFPVQMTDNKGNRWIESNYNGYGIFGGKDYYQLLAEMNNCKELTGDVDKDRSIGINLYFNTENEQNVLFPNLTEDMQWTWRNERPDDCPNQGFFISEEEEINDDDFNEIWFDDKDFN